MISVLLILFVFWYLFESTTGERITIVQVGNNNTVIQDRENNMKTINTKVDISKLIKIEEKYDIQYKKRFLQRPRLTSITPVN